MRRLRIIDDGIDYRHADKFDHDPELREAYECGYKHGRKEAYKEIMEEQYGDSYNHRERGRTYPPMMREHDREWREPEDDEIAYRRRRDSRGRYM